MVRRGVALSLGAKSSRWAQAVLVADELAMSRPVITAAARVVAAEEVVRAVMVFAPSIVPRGCAACGPQPTIGWCDSGPSLWCLGRDGAGLRSLQ